MLFVSSRGQHERAEQCRAEAKHRMWKHLLPSSMDTLRIGRHSIFHASQVFYFVFFFLHFSTTFRHCRCPPLCHTSHRLSVRLKMCVNKSFNAFSIIIYFWHVIKQYYDCVLWVKRLCREQGEGMFEGVIILTSINSLFVRTPSIGRLNKRIIASECRSEWHWPLALVAVGHFSIFFWSFFFS